MDELERKIVSISFVKGFRAAFYDDCTNEIFYSVVDGFAITKDQRGNREVEPFEIDEMHQSGSFESGAWFPADCDNFLRLVRGDSDFVRLDDPSVAKHLKKEKQTRLVAVPGGRGPWLDLTDLVDSKVAESKGWPPQAGQVAKQAFDQAIQEGKSRDDAIDFAYKAGLRVRSKGAL
jgi:hypothetical protein